MNKTVKRYLVSACILAVAVSVLLIYLLNRGAPAIKTDDYIFASTGNIETSELKLQGGDNRVPGMKLAAETNGLSLYFNPDTTEFAVLDKKSGKVWQSNPVDRDSDAKAVPYEKEMLASQFSITFRDRMGRISEFSNYKESIARGQFEAVSIENGVRITYTLGDANLGIDAMPKLISAQRMEEKVLANLDEATAKYVKARYTPLKSNPEILERLDTAVSRELVLKRMLAAFETAGYTLEDLEQDNLDNGIGEGGLADRPQFTIVLHVQLENDSLVVSVPAGEITESDNYRLRFMNLLSAFGAAGVQEEGYMFVPDGTGALINLNNGKFSQEVYAQRLYGEDENNNRRRRGQVSESARLPVFGLKSGNEAWYAIVEKGEGIATVTADISGRNNSYNQAYTGFALRGEDLLELYKDTRVEEIQLLTEKRFTGDIQVRYHFLSGKEANYSGMAKHYRAYLENGGILTPLADEKDIPFYVSVLGAVDKRKTILGVPYRGLVSMTTFDQAGDIAKQLSNDGVGNIQMRYLGWFNEGINHEIPAKVKVDGLLGGLSDLRRLADTLEETGGKLYPDVAFQNVYQTDGRFAQASDAARFVTREQAARSPYNRALNRMFSDLGTYYLLSPAKLPYYVDQFVQKYEKVNNSGLALRDLGAKLHADYRVKRVIFRDTAQLIVQEQLEKIKEKYPELLIAGGNAYALPYASHLVDVPTASSRFAIADAEVPFYQMVLHGYIDYSGEPINLSEEQSGQLQLLKSIELGAAPHFLWTHESSAKLKYTPYDTMYSTESRLWYDEAIDLYRRANEALSDLRTVTIDDRIVHEGNIVEMKYANGTSVYVNYSNQAATINGVRVEANNFALGGGSQ